MTIRYPVIITNDDNGTYLVTCPILPIVVTYGESWQRALANAVDAIETALASMIDDKEDIPISNTEQDADVSSIRLPLQTELKVRLYVALKEAGLTRADLVRRLGWKRESVDRLFRLDHNSRIDQLEMAFNAIGHDIHVDLEPKQAAA